MQHPPLSSHRILNRTLFVVLITAGAVATGILPSAAFAQTPPDLQITTFRVNSPAVVQCGQQVATIRFTETNSGRSASGPYSVRFIPNGLSGPSLDIARPSLPGATSRQVQTQISWFNGPCDCVPTTYTATFQLQIDSLNQVSESDEGNNLSSVENKPGQCP